MDNKFSCFMYQGLTEQDMKSNGGYHHPTYKATMMIKKDGVSITLSPEEIKQIVACAGGSFNR